MKLSKATPTEINKLEHFLVFIEEYLKYGTYSIRDADGDITEDLPEELTPEEFLDLLKERWGGDWGYGAGDVWAKIMVGYRTLVDNACDPDCPYLEWRPDIRAFLDTIQT